MENTGRQSIAGRRTGLFLAAVLMLAALAGCANEKAGDCKEPTPDSKRCKIVRKAPPAPKPSEAQTKDIEGLDLTGLTPAQKALFFDVVEDQFDPCGAPRSFGETLRKHAKGCRIALPLARFVLGRVKAGVPRAAIVMALLEETRRLNHRATFRLEGRPRLGPEDAALTIVEFFDFECPYCREIDPELKKLVERHPQVALVVKQCPIEGHIFAEQASRVALAAAKQGRYWELHRALFAHEGMLDESAIAAAAKRAGLDWEALRADSAGTGLARIIREDLEDADKALVEGTPSLWLDDVEVPFDRMEAIIRERLENREER